MGAPESDLAAGCRAAPVVEPWCDSSAYHWLVFLLARFALHRQCPLTGIQLLLADDGLVATVPPLQDQSLTAFMASEQSLFSTSHLMAFDQHFCVGAAEGLPWGLSEAECAALLSLVERPEPAEPMVVLRDPSGLLHLCLVAPEVKGCLLPAGCSCRAESCP